MPKMSELRMLKLRLKTQQSFIAEVMDENARLIELAARTAKRTTTEVVNVCEYMAIADRLSAIETVRERLFTAPWRKYKPLEIPKGEMPGKDRVIIAHRPAIDSVQLCGRCGQKINIQTDRYTSRDFKKFKCERCSYHEDDK